MRALLDSGTQASFLTEEKAKALMFPFARIQTPIAAQGLAKKQRTLGRIDMKFSNAVDTKLHVIPKNYERQTKTTF